MSAHESRQNTTFPSGSGQAHGYLEESLAFRPDYGPALRRRGVVDLVA